MSALEPWLGECGTHKERVPSFRPEMALISKKLSMEQYRMLVQEGQVSKDVSMRMEEKDGKQKT